MIDKTPQALNNPCSAPPVSPMRKCQASTAKAPRESRQGMRHLVDIELDKEGGHPLAILGVVLADAVHSLRHKLQHQVQEDLILLSGGVEAVL